MAYHKEKKCEKKGMFRAQYVSPYTMSQIDEKTHKLEVWPTKVGVVSINFMVPTFDVVHFALDLNLTKINQVGCKIIYVSKQKAETEAQSK